MSVWHQKKLVDKVLLFVFANDMAQPKMKISKLNGDQLQRNFRECCGRCGGGV
jgi:hypothetical protein